MERRSRSSSISLFLWRIILLKVSKKLRVFSLVNKFWGFLVDYLSKGLVYKESFFVSNEDISLRFVSWNRSSNGSS